MNADTTEQAIRTWEKRHKVAVSPDTRRKIQQGYLPTNERACWNILDTIRQTRPKEQWI